LACVVTVLWNLLLQSATAVNDSKCSASFAEKLSFLANKLRAAKSSGALFIATNQETVQGQLIY